MSSFLLIVYYLLCSEMRLVATLMLASEVFFLKLKPFILTGIAGGLIALKLQAKSGISSITALCISIMPLSNCRTNLFPTPFICFLSLPRCFAICGRLSYQ